MGLRYWLLFQVTVENIGKCLETSDLLAVIIASLTFLLMSFLYSIVLSDTWMLQTHNLTMFLLLEVVILADDQLIV